MIGDFIFLSLSFPTYKMDSIASLLDVSGGMTELIHTKAYKVHCT